MWLGCTMFCQWSKRSDISSTFYVVALYLHGIQVRWLTAWAQNADLWHRESVPSASLMTRGGPIVSENSTEVSKLFIDAGACYPGKRLDSLCNHRLSFGTRCSGRGDAIPKHIWNFINCNIGECVTSFSIKHELLVVVLPETRAVAH